MQKLSACLAAVILLFSLIVGPRASAATIVIDDDNTPTAPDYLSTNYSSDSLCIQAAINAATSGDTITIREGDYWLPTQITSSKNLNFTGDGEVNLHIALGTVDPGFYFTGTRIMESSFTTNAAKDSSTITLASTAGVDAGDLVRIYNNVAWSAEDDEDLMTGETYVAQSVVGNEVTLTSALERDYTTANVSKAIFYHPVEVNMTGLRFLGAGTAAEVQGVTYEFCKNSSVMSSYFRANGMAAIYLRTCHNVEVGNNEIYDSNTIGYGYGVAPVNATSVVNIHDNLIRNCRHGITSGNSTTQGVNRDIVITDNTLYRDNGISVPIDAHPTTIDYTVTGNTIYAGHYDTDGNLLDDDEPAFHDGTVYSIFSNNRVYDAIGVQHRGLTKGGTKIITGNTITGTNASIVTQYGGDFKEFDIENNVLVTNVGTSYYGINLSINLTIETLTIKNNSIKNAQNGIYVSTINATPAVYDISNNTVEDSDWNGIQFAVTNCPSTSSFNIADNIVKTAGRSGMWIAVGGGTGSSVRNVHGNTISNTGRATVLYGMRLVGTNYTNVYDNVITDDTSRANYGVNEETGSDYNEITYNRIIGMNTGLVNKIGTNTIMSNNGDIATDSLGQAFPTEATYTLTVNNGGTGSGTFAPGAAVSVSTAASLPSGKTFTEWKGGFLSALLNYRSTSTTFTMPANDAVLNPYYMYLGDANKHALTVTGGTGSGSYNPEVVVTIVADAAPAGQVFDRWAGDTTGVVDITDDTTTIVMPASVAALCATYKDVSSILYELTVTGGTGSGSYAKGSSVIISASIPPTGQVFDRWSGYTGYLSSSSSATTTMTIPPSTAYLTATYKTISATTYLLAVDGGTGSGSYTAGHVISITAGTPASGKVFDCWTGADSFVANATASATTLTMPGSALTVTATYKDVTATPTFSPTAGSYAGTQSVTLSTSTEGASIYYTTNGDTPTAASTLYSVAISVSSSTTIKAIATKTGFANSEIATAIFAISDAGTPLYVLTITGGIGSGSLAEGVTVAVAADAPATGKVFDRWTGDTTYISDATSDAATVTMPSQAVSLTANYKDICATPTFSVATGSYSGAQSVTLATATEGASIYYTTDGITTPTVSATHYAGAINVASATTIKAIAIKAGCADSALATAVYAIYDAGTPLYALVVTGGMGSGSHASGVTVAVAADAPAAGKVFDRWTGDIDHLSSTTLSATTFVVPAETSTITATYKDKCATPVFSLSSGTYTGTQSVTLTTATAGAGIYYTTNGTTPTSTSTLYASAISVSSATTIKAIAILADCADSEVALAVYGFNTTTSSGGGGGGGGSATPAIKPVIDKIEVLSVSGNQVTLLLSVINAYQMSLSATSDFKNAAWESYSARKTYNKTDSQTTLYAKFKSATGSVTDAATLTLTAGSAVVPTTPAPTTGTGGGSSSSSSYATGTLLKLADSFKVYVIIDGKKKWISTPEVFEQLGYQWTEIKILTATELNAFADYEDNLIRQIGDYKVYLVVDGVRRHIPNPVIFLDYGFKWDEVKDVPVETMAKYKPAFLLKQSGQDGIYFILNGVRKLIPTTGIFESYGDKIEDVQIVSKAELESYPLTQLVRLDGASDIYLVSGTIKKLIPSAAVFAKYKFSWDRVIAINRTEFDYYQDGGTLQ